MTAMKRYVMNLQTIGKVENPRQGSRSGIQVKPRNSHPNDRIIRKLERIHKVLRITFNTFICDKRSSELLGEVVLLFERMVKTRGLEFAIL